jgi:hypothetical protein
MMNMTCSTEGDNEDTIWRVSALSGFVGALLDWRWLHVYQVTLWNGRASCHGYPYFVVSL